MTNPKNQYGWFEYYTPGTMPEAARKCAEILEREFPGMAAVWLHAAPTSTELGTIAWKLTADVLPTSRKTPDEQ